MGERMPSTKNYLYSVGPGSIGPGTSITESLFDPSQNRGVITRMHQDDNGISVSDLAALKSLSEAVFPGTATVLNRTYARLLSDNLAVVVSYYGQSSSASGFRTVLTRSPSGYRQEPFWDVTDDYTSKPANYIGDPVNGQLRPKAILTIPLIVVRWSDVVYSDTRPSDNAGLIGKVNSASKTIDGYPHAAETLKFGGTQIRHDKYGGYDRWTVHNVATYDPYYKHRTSPPPIQGAVPRDNGTWTYTLVNSGDGEQNNPTASFAGL